MLCTVAGSHTNLCEGISADCRKWQQRWKKTPVWDPCQIWWVNTPFPTLSVVTSGGGDGSHSCGLGCVRFVEHFAIEVLGFNFLQELAEKCGPSWEVKWVDLQRNLAGKKDETHTVQTRTHADNPKSTQITFTITKAVFGKLPSLWEFAGAVGIWSYAKLFGNYTLRRNWESASCFFLCKTGCQQDRPESCPRENCIFFCNSYAVRPLLVNCQMTHVLCSGPVLSWTQAGWSQVSHEVGGLKAEMWTNKCVGEKLGMCCWTFLSRIRYESKFTWHWANDFTRGFSLSRTWHISLRSDF